MSGLFSAESTQAHLDAMVNRALLSRLESHSSYSPEEITKIRDLDFRILPRQGIDDRDSLERFRALARLSRCSLTSPTQISSHRRYVGALIVLLKRAVWPFLNAQLKGTLDAQEEFNSLMLESLIREHAASTASATPQS